MNSLYLIAAITVVFSTCLPVVAGIENVVVMGKTGSLSAQEVSDHPQATAKVSASASSSIEVNADGTLSTATTENKRKASASTNEKGEAPPEEYECVDKHDECTEWATSGECTKNPTYLSQHCPHACGVCSQMMDTPHLGLKQEVAGDDETIMAETMDRLYKAKQYVQKLSRDQLKNCIYRNKLCGFWAATGECESNPDHLKLFCAPVCGSCEEIKDLSWQGSADMQKTVNVDGSNPTGEATAKPTIGKTRANAAGDVGGGFTLSSTISV